MLPGVDPVAGGVPVRSTTRSPGYVDDAQVLVSHVLLPRGPVSPVSVWPVSLVGTRVTVPRHRDVTPRRLSAGGGVSPPADGSLSGYRQTPVPARLLGSRGQATEVTCAGTDQR